MQLFIFVPLYFLYFFSLKDGHVISYLPLSHIAAQMTDIISSIIIGHTVWFAQPDAFKESLRDTLLVNHAMCIHFCTIIMTPFNNNPLYMYSTCNSHTS